MRRGGTRPDRGKASGQRLHFLLESGGSYLDPRKGDEAEIFTIKNERHADYWQPQAYPVTLVIRTTDGAIRWMDVSERPSGLHPLLDGSGGTYSNAIQFSDTSAQSPDDGWPPQIEATQTRIL